VRSLAEVEPFYDAILPILGLSRKIESHIDARGDWHAVDPTHPRHVIEYCTPIVPGSRDLFVGFIESEHTIASETRIAFAIAEARDLDAIEALVSTAGARIVERSENPLYPAIFFEDPVGTRLEICARRPAPET
jgi:catechol-2,3-dioxygenase